MDVIHPKCAGLDVHEDSVVAGARIGTGPTAAREMKTFGSATRDAERLAHRPRLHPRGDGGDRRLRPCTGLSELSRSAAGCAIASRRAEPIPCSGERVETS